MKKEERQLKAYQEKVNQIQEKVNQADSFLILKNSPQAEKKAETLLEESWQELSPLVNIASTFPPAFSNQVLTLKNNISENLYKINKLIKIAEPELVFEFFPHQKTIGGGFIHQKIVSFQENLYFFSPYSENIFEVNQNGETKVLSIDKKFSSAIALTDSILFFEKPDKLINLKDNLFQTSILLEPSYPGFNFNELSSYKSNLYFLDKAKLKIGKGDKKTRPPYRSDTPAPIQ